MSSAVSEAVKPITAPILIGHSFNWLGFGSLVVQCYVYHTTFPNDRLIIRLLVWTVFILQIAQTVTTSHQTYWYLVTHWGDPEALMEFPWSAMTVPFVDGLVAAAVQTFYVWRVWSLGQTVLMKCAAVAIGFVSLASALTAMISAAYFAAHSSRELLLQLQPAFATWLATGLAADVLVAASMIWILYTAKVNTMWPTSESMITRMINNTVGTGFAVAMIGLLTLILFLTASSSSLQYLSGAYILGKMYANTLMVTLNARKSSRSQQVTQMGSSHAQSQDLPMRIRVARQTHTDRGQDSFGKVDVQGVGTYHFNDEESDLHLSGKADSHVV